MPGILMNETTLEWTLRAIADLELSIGGESSRGWPDRWLNAGHMRCRNGHLSTQAIEAGDSRKCLVCREQLFLTFPEDDTDEPFTISVIRRLRWLVSRGKRIPVIAWNYGPRRVDAEVVEVRPLAVPSVVLRFTDRFGVVQHLETTQAHRIGDVQSQQISGTSGHWLERAGAEALGWFWREPEGSVCPCGCESAVSYTPAGEPTHACPKCRSRVHRRPDRKIASHTVAWVNVGGDLPVGVGCDAWGYTPEQVRERCEREKLEAQRKAQSAERRRRLRRDNRKDPA